VIFISSAVSNSFPSIKNFGCIDFMTSTKLSSFKKIIKSTKDKAASDLPLSSCEKINLFLPLIFSNKTH